MVRGVGLQRRLLDFIAGVEKVLPGREVSGFVVEFQGNTVFSDQRIIHGQDKR